MKNNTAQATKVITAHVPLPMADKVDQMAARLERSRAGLSNRRFLIWRGYMIFWYWPVNLLLPERGSP